MFGFDAPLIASIIVAVLTGGALNELISYWRNRKKDKAVANLTDIQALQAKLSYMETIHNNLQRHNDNLQEDYNELEERSRRQNSRIRELEEEVALVRTNARTLQQQCDQLERKISQLTTD